MWMCACAALAWGPGRREAPLTGGVCAGEAMVAAQALSLLGWDAVVTLALNPEPPALLTYHGRALRPQAVGLFVEALLVPLFPSPTTTPHAHTQGFHAPTRTSGCTRGSPACATRRSILTDVQLFMRPKQQRRGGVIGAIHCHPAAAWQGLNFK